MPKKQLYVAIRLSSNKQRYVAGNRYLYSIDEHWYETTDTPMFTFPANDIPMIKEWLKKHFINSCEFITPDNNNVIWDGFNSHMVQVLSPNPDERKQERKKVNGFSFIFKKSAK